MNPEGENMQNRSKLILALIILALAAAPAFGSTQAVNTNTISPTLKVNVTTGSMVLGPEAIRLARGMASSANTDLMTHLLPAALKKGLRVAAFFTSEAWYDVGTVSSFEKLDMEIQNHPPSFLPIPWEEPSEARKP